MKTNRWSTEAKWIGYGLIVYAIANIVLFIVTYIRSIYGPN